MGEIVNTGGDKEFVYTKKDLDRMRNKETKTKKEIEKITKLLNFLNNPENEEVEKDTRSFIMFHKIKINLLDTFLWNKKFHITLQYEWGIKNKKKFRSFYTKDCLSFFEKNFPDLKYKLIIKFKKYLIFSKQIEKEINLTEDLNIFV